MVKTSLLVTFYSFMQKIISLQVSGIMCVTLLRCFLSHSSSKLGSNLLCYGGKGGGGGGGGNKMKKENEGMQ